MCMVTHIARVWIISLELPILHVGRLNRENEYFPVPVRASEKFVSRDGFGRPVPRQPAHLHTQAESDAYLRDSSRVPRRRSFIYFNHHTPSGQSRVYRVTQLRTDGVHCRESTGTGPVNLKVVPYGCCLGRSPQTILICASLSHTHYWYKVGMLKVPGSITPRLQHSPTMLRLSSYIIHHTTFPQINRHMIDSDCTALVATTVELHPQGRCSFITKRLLRV